MRQYILPIVIVLSMAATPLLAAVSPPLSCNEKKCCHTMEAHHGMAGMRDKACQCHRIPLGPCHIATDPQALQGAIVAPHDRGQRQNLLYVKTSVETAPDGSLPAAFARTCQGLRPDHHPPPLFLLACTFII